MAANLVTPKITGPDKIYFDSQAGLKDPKRILGPNEGSTAPQEITLSFTQSEVSPPANKTYKADGTLSRTNDNLELYKDKTLSEASKLDFCGNKARIANGDLAAGLKLYAKGVNVGFCTLKLELDLLETATRKQTDFTTNMPETLINVDQTSVNGTLNTQLIAKEMVAPAIRLGTPDTQVKATGTPVALNFNYSTDAASSDYTGGGTVTIAPTDADILFYSDAGCDPSKIVDVTGGYAISNSDLKSGTKTLYARAKSDTASGPVTVLLTLDAATGPVKVSTGGPASSVLTLVPINQLTPKIAVSIDGSFDGKLWFPALAKTPRPTVTFSLDQSNDAVKFDGSGIVTRSADNIALFYDEALTIPLTFIDNKAAVPLAAITGKIPFYLQGSAAGDTTLTFKLVSYCQPSVMTGDAASSSVSVAKVTEVAPKVIWTEPDVPELSADEAGKGTVVSVYLEQLSSGGGDFTGTAKLTRGSKDLAVYTAEKTPVFSDSDLTATLPNDAVMDSTNSYTVQWEGDASHSDPASLQLTLTPTPSEKPYIVTAPGTQFLTPQQAKQPPLTVAPKDTVTPVIQTAYDLVLLSTDLVDGDKAFFTQATPAHIYLTQSNTDVGYDGDGTLKRSNGNVRVFLDADCTQEIPFVSNEAVLTNAVLKNENAVYYLQGATAGACDLSLTLAKVPEEKGIRPNFQVGDPVTKKLAVIAVKLGIYRDDGTQPLIPSVAMTDRAKRLTGRFLPLQNVSNQFGRAKVVVAEVDTASWPSTANKHVVTLNISSDKVAAWSADKGGEKKASFGSPLQLAKSDLSSDSNYYLQSDGDEPSGKLRDITVSLGLDRTDKGSADYPGKPDSIKPLQFGDWAAATVVKFTAVKPDADAWRQYTNQPIDYSLTENSNQDKAKQGQHMLVTAITQPALKGIGINFRLVPGTKNATDQTAPATLLPNDLDKLLPITTDGAGKASTRAALSRYGGDVFNVVGFLADDAATGATTFGKDAAAVAATPDAYKSKPVTVWKKQKFNAVYMKRHDDVGVYENDYSDMFDTGRMRSAFGGGAEEDGFLELEPGSSKIVANVPVLYEDDTLSPTGSGKEDPTWLSEMETAGNIPPPEDRAFTVVFVETLAEDFKPIARTFDSLAPAGTLFTTPIENCLFDLSGRTSYLEAGSVKLMDDPSGSGWTEPVSDSKVTLKDSNNGQFTLEIDLAGVDTHSKPYADLYLKVTLYNIEDYCGYSADDPVVLTACRYAEQRGAQANNEVYSTAVHEVGHYCGLAPETMPDKDSSGNIEWYQGSSGQTQYWARDVGGKPTSITTYGAKIGQGPHCMTAYPDFTDLSGDRGNAAKIECLMYHATVKPPVITLCDTCKKSVKGREYALSKTSSNGSY